MSKTFLVTIYSKTSEQTFVKMDLGELMSYIETQLRMDLKDRVDFTVEAIGPCILDAS